jgi:hypothetical protein
MITPKALAGRTKRNSKCDASSLTAIAHQPRNVQQAVQGNNRKGGGQTAAFETENLQMLAPYLLHALVQPLSK